MNMTKMSHLDKLQLVVSQPGESPLQCVPHLPSWNPNGGQVRVLLHDMHLMSGQVACGLHNQPQLIYVSLPRKQRLPCYHLHQQAACSPRRADLAQYCLLT